MNMSQRMPGWHSQSSKLDQNCRFLKWIWVHFTHTGAEAQQNWICTHPLCHMSRPLFAHPSLWKLQTATPKIAEPGPKALRRQGEPFQESRKAGSPQTEDGGHTKALHSCGGTTFYTLHSAPCLTNPHFLRAHNSLKNFKTFCITWGKWRRPRKWYHHGAPDSKMPARQKAEGAHRHTEHLFCFSSSLGNLPCSFSSLPPSGK